MRGTRSNRAPSQVRLAEWAQVHQPDLAPAGTAHEGAIPVSTLIAAIILSGLVTATFGISPAQAITKSEVEKACGDSREAYDTYQAAQGARRGPQRDPTGRRGWDDESVPSAPKTSSSPSSCSRWRCTVTAHHPHRRQSAIRDGHLRGDRVLRVLRPPRPGHRPN
jgi:hypothetical protein